MSATVAMTPSPAPHDRSSYIDLAHPSPSGHPKLTSRLPAVTAAPVSNSSTTTSQSNHSGSRPGSKSTKSSSKPGSFKTSPVLSRSEASTPVLVKKEPPSSPDLRHRPQKLDLSSNNGSSNNSSEGTTSSAISSLHPPVSRNLGGPLTARIDGLGIQEVGLACLSPGFNTQDPTMRDHLQKSLSVREQQRTLIEARMNKQSARLENSSVENTKDRETSGGSFAGKTPGIPKRKAPPGLSIVAPSHEDFTQERVIQSAPLNQSFTTGRYQPQPLTRHVTNQPSNLSNTSHIHHISSHSNVRSPARAPSSSSNTATTTTTSSASIQHVPAIQSSNRLPPIMDIFAGEHLSRRESGNQGSSTHSNNSSNNSSHSNTRPPFHSPGQSTVQPPHSARPREYRSAEDAQVELSGGRPELLPKLVHYGGHQPPTPPSPRTMKTMKQTDSNSISSRSGGNSRRRTRVEYEEGESPPLGNGPSSSRRTTAPFGEGRGSPMNTTQMKREQFIRLCAEAWDLFHS